MNREHQHQKCNSSHTMQYIHAVVVIICTSLVFISCSTAPLLTPSKFNLGTMNTNYGEKSHYGYDLNTHQGSGQPFFFSVDVPEGNYQVKVVLGNKTKACVTTVKAESRRLMLEGIRTAPNQFDTCVFNVNIRNAQIVGSDSVKLKPREIGKLIWDNKLTLEFNGENPSVTEIEVLPIHNIPTLFLAGNSTMVDQSDEPWCGWGQMLPRFLTAGIVAANYAESGEAANTFVSSKRFAKLLTKAQSGDYLFIEFGHNDEKQQKPGNNKGPYTSYTRDLKYMVDSAKAKGIHAVIISPMHRRFFDKDGMVINTHGDYPDAARKVAEDEGIPCIDLTAMSKILYEAWGPEESKKAFVQYPANTFPNQPKELADNTHFNAYGGYEITRCVLKGIVDNNLPIKQFIIPSFQSFNPAHPDAIESINIPRSPFLSLVKPDGN